MDEANKQFTLAGKTYLADGGDTVALEEHMLGTAQADALGAQLSCPDGVAGGIGCLFYTSPEMRQRVLRNVGAEQAKQKKRQLTRRLVTLAACLAIVVCCWYVWKPKQPDPPEQGMMAVAQIDTVDSLEMCIRDSRYAGRIRADVPCPDQRQQS